MRCTACCPGFRAACMGSTPQLCVINIVNSFHSVVDEFTCATLLIACHIYRLRTIDWGFVVQGGFRNTGEACQGLGMRAHRRVPGQGTHVEPYGTPANGLCTRGMCQRGPGCAQVQSGVRTAILQKAPPPRPHKQQNNVNARH